MLYTLDANAKQPLEQFARLMATKTIFVQDLEAIVISFSSLIVFEKALFGSFYTCIQPMKLGLNNNKKLFPPKKLVTNSKESMRIK